MKVWAVVYSDYDDYSVIGLFKTRALAVKARARYIALQAEEWKTRYKGALGAVEAAVRTKEFTLRTRQRTSVERWPIHATLGTWEQDVSL